MLVAILMLTGVAHSATLNLSGTITTSCVLNQVTPTSYTTLNVVSGETVVVAQTDVSCNNAPGFKLRASSANNGVLVNGSAPNNTASYTMKIYGTGTQGPIGLTTSAQDLVNTGTLAAPVTNESRNIEVVLSAGAPTGDRRTVSFTLGTPNPGAFAGTYTDSILVTLTSTE